MVLYKLCAQRAHAAQYTPQALVNHRLPLSPLARPTTIPGLNIGTELVGEGTSSRRLQRQMRYALESGSGRLKRGSKWVVFIRLGTTTGLGSFLDNHGFDPFLSHLWSQIGPFSRPFRPLEGPKLLNMGSKWAHSTCLCTPNSPNVSLEKHIFDPYLSDFWSQNSRFSKHFVTV